MRQRGGELENYYEEGDENYDGVVVFYDKEGKIESRGGMNNDTFNFFKDNHSIGITKESEWYNAYYKESKTPDKIKYLLYIHNQYNPK